MRKFMLLMALLLLYGSSVMAQVTQASGTVYDASDNSPLIGATVSVAGTKIATMTDLDGKFLLKGLTPSHQKIVVTYVGCVKQELKAAANMQVYMQSDTKTMDQVIVVAFGKQKREAFTGSATVVNSQQIQNMQVTNPVEALSGKVAGLQITDNNSVGTGTSSTILVRGISSLNASNDPLIVVDGVPFVGYLSDINPADIDNMTVLKDAASNALYGARGANGVIMITTKKAQKGTTRVTVDAKWGANTDGRVEYDIIRDPGQYYEAYYQALKNYYMYRQDSPMGFDQAHATVNNALGTPLEKGYGLGYMVYDVPQGEYLIGTNGRVNPHAVLGNRTIYNNEIYTLYPDNWYKAGTRNGLRQEYNVSLSGGGDKTSLMATIGYLDNEGLTLKSDMQRFNSNMKFNYQAYDFLNVNASATYTNSQSETMSSILGTRYMAPIYPLYIRNGNGDILTDFNGPRYDYGNYDMGCIRPYDTNGNVMQDDLLNRSLYDVNSFNMQGAATLDFLDGFHFTANGAVYVNEERAIDATNPYYGYNVSSGGGTTVGHYRTMNLNYQQLLNYSKNFSGHSVDVLFGHEYTRQTDTSLWASASKFGAFEKNLELSGAIIKGDASSSTSLYNVEGWFGRAQYDYDSRYFFSASYRRDGSSRFHPKHRWGNFWSVGGAWIMSKENWFPKSEAINSLKLKASYGEQGNDGIGNFRYTDTYSLSNSNNNVAFSFSSKGRENISWEKVGNFNTGLEFNLFGNRLNGSVDYYYRKTSDMLMWFSAPVEIGYSGYYDNVGDMVNSGIEFNLDGTLVNAGGFTWSASANGAWQRNRITYIPEEKRGYTLDGYSGYVSGNYFDAEGLSMYTIRTRKWAGVNENGEPLYYKKLEDGTETTTTAYDQASYYLCGTSLPTFFGGVTTSLAWNGFEVSAQFNYSLGGKKLDSGYQSLISSPNSTSAGNNFHRDVFNAWDPTRPETQNGSMSMFVFNDKYGTSLSDRFFISANYLTFKNLSISYTLPKSAVKAMRLNNVRVFALCENLAYWTARKGFDPRGSITSGSYGGWPTMRTISGGVSLQF